MLYIYIYILWYIITIYINITFVLNNITYVYILLYLKLLYIIIYPEHGVSICLADSLVSTHRLRASSASWSTRQELLSNQLVLRPKPQRNMQPWRHQNLLLLGSWKTTAILLHVVTSHLMAVFFEDPGIFLFSLCFKLMVSQQSPFKIQAILLLPHRWMWKFTRLTNWTYIYIYTIYHIFHFFEYGILYVTYHNVYYIYYETCIIFHILYMFISLISLEITFYHDMIWYDMIW